MKDAKILFCSAAFFCVVALGCRTAPDGVATSGTPLFPGTGTHHRAITTTSSQAQRYFDQGLIFAYAFNHDEAIRSFQEAARLDPSSAMAWWGVALSYGPHINNPVVSAGRSAKAWDALQQALQLKSKASLIEQALIEALSRRYASPAPADRSTLDLAYAKALEKVWIDNKSDADIATWHAEALMDLQPWDLWASGVPKGNTQQIVNLLEAALRLNPNHPGALHLYIHAMENSGTPARAIPAADRLRKLVPIAGHLVHMPSHIDVLTGRWSEAIDSNIRAMDADRRYRKLSPQQDFLHVYMAHDNQMLAFAAMMQGRSKLAIESAQAIRPAVPAEWARRESVAIESFFNIYYDTLVRFGKWDDILTEPAPPDYLPVTTAMWRFARAIAFAAKNQVREAREAQAEFKASKAKIPPERVLAINPAQHVLGIADHVIKGEIAYREGNSGEAISELKKAIELEDALVYMEPPEWAIPVRHALGAILLEAGRPKEAEEVYRDDLKKWPENGWALYGLGRALRLEARTAEAAATEARYKKAWAKADTQITTTCLCVRK